MTTQELIVIARENHVLKLGINRPEKKNALTRDMYGILCEQITGAKNDDDIRIVLLYGENQMFCSGNDLFDFDNRKKGEKSAAEVFLHILNEFEKPIIAAVDGFAVGIGVTMLMHCDLVYAGENTRFNMPFVNLGVVPEGASTLLLPINAGYKKAAKALFFADFFTAQEAMDLDIVTRILPSETVLTTAVDAAKILSQKPQKALMTTKKLLKHSMRETISDRIVLECGFFEKMLLSKESIAARERVKNKNRKS